MIGAHVLNVSKQDYDPQGASVTMLLAENNMLESRQGEMEEVDDRIILAHLDKSHITVHTYPEYHPETSTCYFSRRY